jgi:cytidylate kinase
MVSAFLTDTPVKIALEAEVEARAKRVKYKRSFSGSQDRSIKSKKLKKYVRTVDSSEEEDEHFYIKCAKP